MEETSSSTLKTYIVGDEITYNEMKFYVISPSDTTQDYVTLLKDEPIKYIDADWSTTEIASKISQDSNVYLQTAYLYSDTCVSAGDTSGCSTNYGTSSVKQIVDAWSNAKLTQSDLKEVEGYKARLIKYQELITNLGYEAKTEGTIFKSTNGETPDWVYNSNYWYLTMSAYNDFSFDIYGVDNDGRLFKDHTVYNYEGVVRPVINLLKSAI